ncbi:MAG: ATP-binding protein [Bacteroidales bacterium]|jgi:predicted AAA+ superfamily ATPase|nr:ATP-binding protein [Bacteroidales bacterium]
MVSRIITEKLHYLATKYPVLTLTGSRQCGKSTLLKSIFPNYRYVSLEDLDMRMMAKDDPRGFLENFGSKTIIDEAQYVPELFSYIQTKVDAQNEVGMYILSGSHNFLLLQNITQSLAGRTAVLKLAPFSISELKTAGLLPQNLNTWLYTGGYPRIYDKQIEPTDFYPHYIQTYIDRDIRTIRDIANLSQFVRFLKLCAARVGQLINLSSLANDAEITVPTARAWLSLLESSYVLFLLKPYHNNFNKRLTKSPKLYFYDTGLVSSLLGLEHSDQLSTHYLRGELFENMVVSEIVKTHFFEGKEPQLYFWRDSNKHEVDLLIETGGQLQAIEIKSSATMKPDFFANLELFRSISGIKKENLSVVYGGDTDYTTQRGRFVSWKNL